MPVIEVDGLVKRYAGKTAVDGVDVTVEEGEILGVLGPNGAGKTTAVECIAGLRTPTAGEVRVLGLDPVRDRRRLRQVVGVQLQKAVLPDDIQVGEALELYRSFYRERADVDPLLADLGIADKRTTRFKELSGGQMQRLSLALALVGRPRIALLDELTTGLDPQGRRDIWRVVERLRADGTTVVLVSHFMEEVERLCDRVAVIDDGRIVAGGTPRSLVDGLGGSQRLHLRTTPTVDPRPLEALPQVSAVTVDGDRLTVTGTGDLLHIVTSAVAEQETRITETRLEQATLEDAYLALTGRAPETSDLEEATA